MIQKVSHLLISHLSLQTNLFFIVSISKDSYFRKDEHSQDEDLVPPETSSNKTGAMPEYGSSANEAYIRKL